MKVSNTFILSCLFFMTGCSVPNNINLQKDISATNVEKNVSNIYHTKNNDLPDAGTTKSNDSAAVLTNYGLSVNFMSDLKSFVNDKVLNKTEIKMLTEKTSSDSERNFIRIIKNKKSFSMSNIKENSTDADTLSFIVNKDFDINGSFLKSFSQNSISNEKITAEEKDYINSLAKQDVANILTLDQNENIKEVALKLSYDENQIIPGNNLTEIIGNIGQGDNLDETLTDNFRCGAAVI